MKKSINQSIDWNSLSDNQFRKLVVDFIEENLPPRLRFMKRRALWSECKDWYLSMSSNGLLVPNWPIEWGGKGIAPGKMLIHVEEMERRGAPMGPVQGPVNLGPLLIAYGTDEQRKKYLPKILSGDHRWCQAYSEPNAGSDLASLKTEAVIEGDHFVVNGQKIWTSMAHDSNMMYALVRTDKNVKKQAGISFLIIEMDQPGLTVRPIKNILGDYEQCEIFFDNVKSHVSNLVGEINQGWTISKSLLGFERIFNGSPRHCVNALTHLERMAKAMGKMEDPIFLDKLTQMKLDVLDLASAYDSYAQTIREGGSFGNEVSLLKIWATETCQNITELMVESAGEAAALKGDVNLGDDCVDVLHPFFESRILTIYGGSSQVQRNIIAKTTLNLPS